MKMTPEIFTDQMNELLQGLPNSVKHFIVANSWERGHSAGLEEVMGIARGLKADMQEIIDEINRKGV